jgi:hypothetical protein
MNLIESETKPMTIRTGYEEIADVEAGIKLNVKLNVIGGTLLDYTVPAGKKAKFLIRVEIQESAV